MKSGEADKERGEITGHATIVALGTLASRLLGLARDIVLAAVFSRTATDAWLIAWQIPNLLRQILAEGAVQTAVLPVLNEVIETEGEESGKRFFRAMAGFMGWILVTVSLLGVFFAAELVRLFAPGFATVPGQLEKTTELTRWVFPYIFLMGSAALGLAALNTHRRFVVTSFAPALLNVGFLLAALLLPAWLGAQGKDRILAMAIGGLSGGVMQVVAQWPSLRKIGYLKPPTSPFSHPKVREALRRLAPTLLGIGVYSVDVVVGRRLLSSLGEGAVTYFSYGLRLCDFSQGIFVMALSSATLPTLARFAARGDLVEVRSTLSFSLRLALFIGIAATLGSLILSQPLVATVFERGKFDQTATLETSRAFSAQALGIFLVAGVRQLVIVFFALGKTMVPVYVAVVDLVVFFGLGLGLSQSLGHVGVSLAVTGARVTQFTLLWLLLGRHLGGLPNFEILRSFTSSLLAALAGATAAAGSLWAVRKAPELHSAQALVETVLGGTSFIVAFVACAWVLGSEELKSASEPLLRRLLGKRK